MKHNHIHLPFVSLSNTPNSPHSTVLISSSCILFKINPIKSRILFYSCNRMRHITKTLKDGYTTKQIFLKYHIMECTVWIHTEMYNSRRPASLPFTDTKLWSI